MKFDFKIAYLGSFIMQDFVLDNVLNVHIELVIHKNEVSIYGR